MYDLLWYQYALIGLIFVWTGFVRSGLGFGGAVLSLPFLLLIVDDPLLFLPIISAHLLFFVSIAFIKEELKRRRAREEDKKLPRFSVDWPYLKHALGIMIVPKIIGIFGLITLPGPILTGIVFIIVAVYSVSYIIKRPFTSKNKYLDVLFLMLGGYISGTSLIGGPLIIAVFSTHVARHQLRNTLFMLWYILVAIKMAGFIYAGVDLQLIHHLWLLPCAAIGTVLGLFFHEYLQKTDASFFYQILGCVLLLTSILGLAKVLF